MKFIVTGFSETSSYTLLFRSHYIPQRLVLTRCEAVPFQEYKVRNNFDIS
jgi:hypothetical protein